MFYGQKLIFNLGIPLRLYTLHSSPYIVPRIKRINKKLKNKYLSSEDRKYQDFF